LQVLRDYSILIAHYCMFQELHIKVISLYFLQGINQKYCIRVTMFNNYLCQKKKAEQKHVDFPVLMDF